MSLDAELDMWSVAELAVMLAQLGAPVDPEAVPERLPDGSGWRIAGLTWRCPWPLGHGVPRYAPLAVADARAWLSDQTNHARLSAGGWTGEVRRLMWEWTPEVAVEVAVRRLP